MLNQIENLEKLVIAAINGYALGAGCEIALACDIQIASGNAKIGQTEVKIGIPHGWGGTQRMLRESYFVYPPILCIRFMVGLSSLARIMLIIPSGFFCIHSRICAVISSSDFRLRSKLFRS